LKICFWGYYVFLYFAWHGIVMYGIVQFLHSTVFWGMDCILWNVLYLGTLRNGMYFGYYILLSSGMNCILGYCILGPCGMDCILGDVFCGMPVFSVLYLALLVSCIGYTGFGYTVLFCSGTPRWDRNPIPQVGQETNTPGGTGTQYAYVYHATYV
jgi:hypothetical protein